MKSINETPCTDLGTADVPWFYQGSIRELVLIDHAKIYICLYGMASASVCVITSDSNISKLSLSTYNLKTTWMKILCCQKFEEIHEIK
jgi:hypothetical protein